MFYARDAFLVIANFALFEILSRSKCIRDFSALETRVLKLEESVKELESRWVSDIREVCRRSGDLLTRQLHMIERLNTAHSLLSGCVENSTHELISVRVCVCVSTTRISLLQTPLFFVVEPTTSPISWFLNSESRRACSILTRHAVISRKNGPVPDFPLQN